MLAVLSARSRYLSRLQILVFTVNVSFLEMANKLTLGLRLFHIFLLLEVHFLQAGELLQSI